MSRLHTGLCDFLGIKYPILNAGMSLVAGPDLAAAVSNAGGLGMLGAAELSPGDLRDAIRKIKSATDSPFGVNLLIALGEEVVKKQMEVILEEKVPVLVSGLGDPAPWVPLLHKEGIKVGSMIGKVKHATRIASGGADIIIAQGTEAGGHTGEVGTLALIPQVVDAVEVPVVAAGGIGDGRGLVAALALGAQAVVMGTRFIPTRESAAHGNFKELLLRIKEDQTVVTRAYTGKPCRVVKNEYTERFKGREHEIQPFPQQAFVSFREVGTMYVEGRELGFAPAGQIAGIIDKIEPAGEVVRAVVREAEELLDRMAGSH